MSDEAIPGYMKGDGAIPPASISMAEFDQLKQSAMFTEADEKALQVAGDVLADLIDDILDICHGFVGDHDFLLYYFTDGATPDEEDLD